MSDEIYIGARHYWQRSLSDEELLGPLPEPPAFPDVIANVRDRVRKTIGKVSVARVITIKHPVTSRLLARDEARREKQKTAPLHLLLGEADLRDPVRIAAAPAAQRTFFGHRTLRRQTGGEGT